MPYIGKSVLITGCSSGIGRATACYLAGRGFMVFAGVRKESDARNLRNLGVANLEPVCPLDLAKPEHFPLIKEIVIKKLKELDLQAAGQEGLYGIVNNAGGGFISPIELMDLGKFRAELETRLTGVIGLLQAFLPLVRKAGGRIVWIATPALMPIPFDSSIHACDFAVNNLARTLKIELKPWNIPVIMVKCGAMKTESVERSYHELEESFKSWPEEKAALYKDAINKVMQNRKIMDLKRTDPSVAAKMVFKALADAKPRSRYRGGHMSSAAAFLELLPQALVDKIMGNR